MILVVADTSPIRYLLLIGAIDILPQLFDRVILPDHVAKVELQDPMTPQTVQTWAAHLPTWVEVRKPLNLEEMALHRGESEAIALAKELKAFAILLDDADARRAAASQGIFVIGTLGLLEKAAERGFINLAQAFEKLQRTNFRVDPKLLQEALKRITTRH